MGLVVELRDENGRALARTGEYGGAVPTSFPDLEDESYPMLQYVDRYGNTVFTRNRWMLCFQSSRSYFKERSPTDSGV